MRPPARWDALASLAERRPLTDDVPVITALDWTEAAPLIGFRHISGIQGWDPYPKARFIARLADEEERDFDEIAPLVGEDGGTVRALYRNYRIVEQARGAFRIPTSEAEALFGTFTAALNRRHPFPTRSVGFADVCSYPLGSSLSPTDRPRAMRATIPHGPTATAEST